MHGLFSVLKGDSKRHWQTFYGFAEEPCKSTAKISEPLSPTFKGVHTDTRSHISYICHLLFYYNKELPDCVKAKVFLAVSSGQPSQTEVSNNSLHMNLSNNLSKSMDNNPRNYSSLVEKPMSHGRKVFCDTYHLDSECDRSRFHHLHKILRVVDCIHLFQYSTCVLYTYMHKHTYICTGFVNTKLDKFLKVWQKPHF